MPLKGDGREKSFLSGNKVRFMGLIKVYPMLTKREGCTDAPPKGAGLMEYDFVWVRGHIEVFDAAGRFCFSADNEREAMEELNAA